MRLKPTQKGLALKRTLALEEEEKPKRKKKPNRLPPDEYKPLLPPKRLLVRESETPSHHTKQYVEFSVKRYCGDLVNAPEVYLQGYQESDFYTGYMKGKCIHFPLEMLYDIMDQLTELSEECDKNHIE